MANAFKGDVLLVYLPSQPPPQFLQGVQSKFPNLQVRWVETPVHNGQLLPPDHLTAEQWDGVTMMCIYHVPTPDVIPNVWFFQTASAGTDAWTKHPKYLDPDVIFSNASGCQPYVFAPFIASMHIVYTKNRPLTS